MKLSDIKLKPPKILLYGKFGSGKTAFALTGGSVVQYIDLDGGLLTGLTLKDQWIEERKKVDILSCLEEDRTKALAFRKAKSYIESIADQCSKGTYPFKVLVIDSLTRLSEYGMRGILDANGLLGKNPRLQDWVVRDIMFKEILLAMMSMNIAVLLLAHDQIEDDGEGGQVIVPSIQGKALPPLLNTYFDEILYLRARSIAQGKTQYIIENRSASGLKVRTRSNFENFFDVNLGLKVFLKALTYEI